MDLLLGKLLRDTGIYRAITHADNTYDDWSEKAYMALKDFLKASNGKPFMCEDIREFASDYLPEPPNNRAWGSIITRAKRNGIIKHCGFGQVTNPRAHRANASMWKGA